MKFKFTFASYEVLLSDRPSQLHLAAEVKDYLRCRIEPSDVHVQSDFSSLFPSHFAHFVSTIGSTLSFTHENQIDVLQN